MQAIERMQREYQDQRRSQDASTGGVNDTERTKGPDKLNVEFMSLDLASLSSTMEFINAFKAKGYPLHTLICNAGIAFVLYGELYDIVDYVEGGPRVIAIAIYRTLYFKYSFLSFYVCK